MSKIPHNFNFCQWWMTSFCWHTILKLEPQGSFCGTFISVTKQLWYWAISVCTSCPLLYFQRLQCNHFSSFSVSLVTYMEMPPWTYTSAWHLWELHDLIPSIISHLKASSVHLSHYLSSYKDSQQGKFISSQMSLRFCISRSVQPENEPVPLTVPMRRGAMVLALAAGTNIYPRPQWSKPSKAETKCCAFRGFMLKNNRTDFLLRQTHKATSFYPRLQKGLLLRSEQHLMSALRLIFPSRRHCPGHITSTGTAG